MITLTATSSEWQNEKQYVARIVGRNSKFTFEREFIGFFGAKTWPFRAGMKRFFGFRCTAE